MCGLGDKEDREDGFGGGEMKKNELEMAINILQRVKRNYDSLFDEDGKTKWLTDNRGNTKTQAKQEIIFARRLLLEVAKEL